MATGEYVALLDHDDILQTMLFTGLHVSYRKTSSKFNL